MSQWILATNGRPFTDREAARVKRDLIAAEVGANVRVEVLDHPDGGFAVWCPTRDSRPDGLSSRRGVLIDDNVTPLFEEGSAGAALAPSVQSAAARSVELTRAATHRTEDTRPSATVRAGRITYPTKLSLRPAARASLGELFCMLVGVVCIADPSVLFSFFNLSLPAYPVLARLALNAVVAGGVIVVAANLSRFLWVTVSNRYVLDAQGVTQTSWRFEAGKLARSTRHLPYARLREVRLAQTFPEWVIALGTLKLAAVDAAEFEVILRDVASPRRLQAEIERRARAARDDFPAQRFVRSA